ncbi:MAG: glycine C-acetyltransferase [Candidatus Cloacimonetes bacterium]|jgi:glycine C-acetyltransferase|nr:glycine C-acetyltransferase [Candidatus Cloacimonadota bacterium]MCB5287361.1 glycine C-acetyltransferase [Candidatus Cloacimonadota bacterium]MCK9184336.1 glycine C-acetyltransferase [Candidatus Cloacimonadota bacterium]MCK9583811.1 glycine C-acetyltransferase [Candidatus Cloacimonadota bacterium]MDY0229683.1 glycine C-acetyltransferase [Candidatus Cloacimonadaceae bacterium]
MAFSEKLRARYQDILKQILQSGLYKQERIIHDKQGAKVAVEYPPGNAQQELINMCSNNYLGLSSHPEVIKAAHEALDHRGYGLSSVRFICGTQDIHKELEARLSAFLGTQDTILFSSCFDANAAVFETLLDESAIMISDRLVHASIIDGMRLSRAQHDSYKHSDMKHLRQKLELHQDKDIKIIITDGVFSMDGDIAHLAEIVQLAEEFEALVFVDDSHATGFIGKTGRGSHELCQVMGKIDLISTTFGKALGGASGGCISGRTELIDLLRQRARPYLFSNALAPAITMTTCKVLDILQASTKARDSLERKAIWWRKALSEAGFIVVPGASPIVPVMLYNAKLTQIFADELYARKVFAVGFFFPVVPQAQARIRTQVSAAHTEEDLRVARAAFIEIAQKYDLLGKTKAELLNLQL